MTDVGSNPTLGSVLRVVLILTWACLGLAPWD